MTTTIKRIIIAVFLFNATQSYAFIDLETTSLSQAKANFADASYDLKVHVLNSITGEAISGAKILVGNAPGNPFTGNNAETDGNGNAYFQSDFFQNNQAFTVTANKDGYNKFSFVNTHFNNIEISLVPNPDDSAFAFLDGSFNGWQENYDSDTAELGLFLPALRPEVLLNFDITKIISSYTVKIDIMGQRDIPGNILFPAQDKNYIIFPIHLEKPNYIMPLPKNLNAQMAGVIGTVALRKAIGYIRDKDYLSIFNVLKFNKLNWTDQNINVQNNQHIDLNINRELVENKIQSHYNNIPNGLDIVAIAAVAPNDDRENLIPTDIAALKLSEQSNQQGSPTTIPLRALEELPNNASYYVFSGAFDMKQMSGSSNPESDKTNNKQIAITASLEKVNPNTQQMYDARTERFLNLIKLTAPSSDNKNYNFSSPALKDFSPDIILVNIISNYKNAATKGKMRRIIWTAILPGDATSLQLPTIDQNPILPPPDASKGETFSWEVIAVKAQTSPKQNYDLKEIINNMEYVSSASTSL